MATPHGAGVVSLMLSLKPAMTPAQVLTALRSSARTFPTGTGSDCTVGMCGAGIADAAAALAFAVPPTPQVTGRVNLALASSGGVMTVSSTHSAGCGPAGANNGDRSGANWGNGGGWNDASVDAWPDTLQVNFSGTKTLSEIDVYTVQDAYISPQGPTAAMSFSLYGITEIEAYGAP